MTFDGKWRITAMDLWDQESLDLVVPAYLQFHAGGLGEFQFIAVQGCTDCKYGDRDGRPLVEFSWEGDDDGDSQPEDKKIARPRKAALAKRGRR